MRKLIVIFLFLLSNIVFAGIDAKSGKVINVADGTESTDGINYQQLLDYAAAGGHNILSVAHGDTTTDAVTRGSLIYGNSTPAWDELVLGASGYILRSDGTDVVWVATTNITALGTINTGVWSATALVANKVPDHDNLNNVDVNSHLDWTAATTNFYTTGSGQFDGGIGIGTAPGGANKQFVIEKSLAPPQRVRASLVNNGTGDALLHLYAGSDWTIGVDNDDSDKLTIGLGVTVGATVYLAIDLSGDFDFQSGNFANVGTIAGGAYNGVTFSINNLVIDDAANDNSLTVSGDWTLDQSVASGAAPTFNNLKIEGGIPILIFKDNTDTGDSARGFQEWRDSNNVRLGFFGNSSYTHDDLVWKNESSGGHLLLETTGTGIVSSNTGFTTTGNCAFGNVEPYYDDTSYLGHPSWRWKGLSLSGDADIGGDVDITGNIVVDGTIEGIEIFNSAGDLKIMPDVQGDVHLFGDTDTLIDNAADGKSLYIHRKAAEGEDYLKFYIDAARGNIIASNRTIYFYIGSKIGWLSSAGFGFYADKIFRFGSAADKFAVFKLDTGQTNDAFMYGTPDTSKATIICDYADVDYNFAHAVQSNPTLFVHSANQATTEWISFAHDQTDGVITTGAGDLQLLPATGFVEIGGAVRAATASYRRYYHLSVGGFDPGASGATWVDPSADTTGGWQLNASAEKLIAGTDIHSDWDGVSDITAEIHFALNDTAGGDPNVDLQLIAYYNGVGDTSTKTQTVEVVTDTDGTQYKVYSVEFTLDYDAANNVIDAGDHITFILNLETDTSEIDDIIIIEGSFYYNTTHIGIEAGDI